MTVCNLSIEMGARGGMIAPDEKTFEYIRNREFSPKGNNWNKAMKYWSTLKSDKNAFFDKEIVFDGNIIQPMITYGTNPGMGIKITETIPVNQNASFKKSLEYMNFEAGASLINQPINYVFIGSCTNSRIEDLRAAASIVGTKKIATNIKLALVVPGSGLVKAQAELEGLDKVFKNAGFEWREPGCSMCLAMNADKLSPGERCASTSNRNFEGRQGQGGRTHLVSPQMAAAAAIYGKFVDIRELN